MSASKDGTLSDLEKILEKVAQCEWEGEASLLEYLKRKLLPLLEAGQAQFAKHYKCEDNFYGCPKSEGYFGTDDKTYCSCGKDEWDAACKKAMED